MPAMPPAAARSQVVRRVPVRYAGPKAVFDVPSGAAVARLQYGPVAHTHTNAVLALRVRTAHGLPAAAPAEGAVTLTAAGPASGPVGVQGCVEIEVQVTTAENAASDDYGDVACVFDAGADRVDERRWAD